MCIIIGDVHHFIGQYLRIYDRFRPCIIHITLHKICQNVKYLYYLCIFFLVVISKQSLVKQQIFFLAPIQDKYNIEVAFYVHPPLNDLIGGKGGGGGGGRSQVNMIYPTATKIYFLTA